MSKVSKECGLLQKYTNHSVCVTGCTVLTKWNFSVAEIMVISGHKSVHSVEIYQKTQNKQNTEMVKALFNSMAKYDDEIEKKKEVGTTDFKTSYLGPICSTCPFTR